MHQSQQCSSSESVSRDVNSSGRDCRPQSDEMENRSGGCGGSRPFTCFLVVIATLQPVSCGLLCVLSVTLAGWCDPEYVSGSERDVTESSMPRDPVQSKRKKPAEALPGTCLTLFSFITHVPFCLDCRGLQLTVFVQGRKSSSGAGLALCSSISPARHCWTQPS